MFLNLSAGELTIIVFVMLFSVLPLLLTTLALVSILKNDFQGYNKIIWILIVLFVPVLGAILYYIIGRTQKIAGQ